MKIFKDRPYKRLEVGAFAYEFYYREGDLKGTYLTIGSQSGLWSMRVSGNSHAYGYLLAACEQGLTEQLHGYAVTLYMSAMVMTQNQGLTDDLTRAVTKYMRRMEKAAERAAKSVTEHQEIADGALMASVIERGTVRNRREAERLRDEMRREYRESGLGAGD